MGYEVGKGTRKVRIWRGDQQGDEARDSLTEEGTREFDGQDGVVFIQHAVPSHPPSGPFKPRYRCTPF